MMLVKAIRFVLMDEAGADGGAAGGGATVLTGGENATGSVSDNTAQAQTQTTVAGTGVEGVQSGQSVETGSGNAEQGAQSAENGDVGGETNVIEYQDFQVPEGITLNLEMLGEFKDLAKGFGLKQDQAQALTDMGVRLTQGILTGQAQALESQKAVWLSEAKADKEIGGAQFEANMAVAARAVKAFVPEGLKAVFDSTGIGNHPELVRAFVKIGAMLQEDGVVSGQAGSGGVVSMYPNSPLLK